MGPMALPPLQLASQYMPKAATGLTCARTFSKAAPAVQKSVSAKNADRSKARCQKCLQDGHWTFECKNARAYLSRPSHTDALRKVSFCVLCAATFQFSRMLLCAAQVMSSAKLSCMSSADGWMARGLSTRNATHSHLLPR
jgi:Zinc knuckle